MLAALLRDEHKLRYNEHRNRGVALIPSRDQPDPKLAGARERFRNTARDGGSADRTKQELGGRDRHRALVDFLRHE
ncbi:MAG: hypothetical protein A3F68_01920 [Acidobacteria bacterium RIFCSPLOWO2_12_FULL_54_10]|nr:MAG: hypothetical protein A3F68_01920 [Acidobacteria bacterium RIFCSPLOWO2_12_FULL_54_10]